MKISFITECIVEAALDCLGVMLPIDTGTHLSLQFTIQMLWILKCRLNWQFQNENLNFNNSFESMHIAFILNVGWVDKLCAIPSIGEGFICVYEVIGSQSTNHLTHL